MSGQFSANAPTLGYFYQTRYALLLLFKAEIGSEISIERFDDVAFEKGSNPTQLLQTKHHINNTGSLTNASVDLWKTLRVWSVAVSAGTIDPTIVILSLITTGRAPNDSAASKLRPAGISPRDTEAALVTLRKTAQTSENITNKPAYDAFLALSEPLQRALIGSIQILDASPNIKDVRDELLNELRHTTRPQFIELMYERIEGWWFNKVVEHLIEIASPPILERELSTKINDLQEEYYKDNLPIEFLDEIAPEESNFSEEQRIFIHQLRLVMVGEKRIRRAINDYYRAFAQRSKWMREDLLGVGELQKYEERLIDEWQRLHEIMQEDFSSQTTEQEMQEKGRKLYNIFDTEKEIHIRPRCVEPYIMRGSYHMLANKLSIGWHAYFLDRLNALLSKNSLSAE